MASVLSLLSEEQRAACNTALVEMRTLPTAEAFTSTVRVALNAHIVHLQASGRTNLIAPNVLQPMVVCMLCRKGPPDFAVKVATPNPRNVIINGDIDCSVVQSYHDTFSLLTMAAAAVMRSIEASCIEAHIRTVTNDTRVFITMAPPSP